MHTTSNCNTPTQLLYRGMVCTPLQTVIHQPSSCTGEGMHTTSNCNIRNQLLYRGRYAHHFKLQYTNPALVQGKVCTPLQTVIHQPSSCRGKGMHTTSNYSTPTQLLYRGRYAHHFKLQYTNPALVEGKVCTPLQTVIYETSSCTGEGMHTTSNCNIRNQLLYRGRYTHHFKLQYTNPALVEGKVYTPLQTVIHQPSSCTGEGMHTTSNCNTPTQLLYRGKVCTPLQGNVYHTWFLITTLKLHTGTL